VPTGTIDRNPSSFDENEEFDFDGHDGNDAGEVEVTPGLVEILTQAAIEKIKMEDWSPGLDRQHIGIATLFVRFVGHDKPGRMRQVDIARFKSLLFKLPKNHGKSPRDHTASIDELVARARTLPPEKVGVSPATLNRYMTQMSNIVDICKHAGYPFDSYEGVAGLRAKKRGDVRDERGRFSTDEVVTLFGLPIWNGSAGESERLNIGEAVFHDASYWLPLMAIYNGARREENCGLLVSEIDDDGELPCFRVENNWIRKLKSVQSKRRIPIHPELVRLGFLEYVAALRNCGHQLLFPELRAANTATPMGDVF
jgi:integrase